MLNKINTAIRKWEIIIFKFYGLQSSDINGHYKILPFKWEMKESESFNQHFRYVTATVNQIIEIIKQNILKLNMFDKEDIFISVNKDGDFYILTFLGKRKPCVYSNNPRTELLAYLVLEAQ